MNVERHARWTSVIVFDDVLPRNVREPSRERKGMVAWAGDVFKLLEIFRDHRPDLISLPVDTEPTGLLVVLGADPDDQVLSARYEEIVDAHVYPDPQRVPEDVLRRKSAIDPAALIESPLWDDVRKARESGTTREAGWEGIHDAAEGLPRLPGRELEPDQLRPRGERRKQPGSRPKGQKTLRAVRRRLRGKR
jgi:hypothetical protein